MARTNPSRTVTEKPGTLDHVKQTLTKMHYAVVGDHSAVQLCHWTKADLKQTGQCWKGELYGIKSAGCCQMTPAMMWCDHHCVHCWRPLEMNLGLDPEHTQTPTEIIDGVIEARKKLLSGFGGNPDVDKDVLEEAMDPSLFTFSLSGEATLYPRLGEMIKELRSRGKITFLVTNGVNPDAIQKLIDNEGHLPTQLVVSTNAPNEELYNKWHRSLRPNSWQLFNETLEKLSHLKGRTRRVIRLTLAKTGDMKGIYKDLTNMHDDNVKEYAEMIRKADADLVHVKGFKSIGFARKRMGYDKQPWFEEVEEYARKILAALNETGGDYEVGGTAERSTIVMLKKKDFVQKIVNP